ncbi:MAG: cytochrome P450 [Allosphingosinicella sp.]
MADREPDWNPAMPMSVGERLRQMEATRATCPVAWASRHGGQWDVLRYDDIVAVTSRPEAFSNCLRTRYAAALPPLEYDPPEHRDFRRLLAVFFTPKRLALLEPRIRAAARGLLAPILAQGRGDFAKGYSYPLPVIGLCALLDIDEAHVADIKAWSEHTLLMDSDDAGHREIAIASHERIITFAHTLIEDRRRRPRAPEEDVTAAIMAARVNGAPLDDDTIARTLRLLISAGHNSTTSGIGNSLLHLARQAEDQAILRRSPELIPAAVDEFLRLDTPVQEMPRFATEDAVVGGREIAAGERLGMFWAAGNRDPAAFPDPDRFSLERRPNRHLAFGNGIHTCIGAPMARLEMKVAIEELFACTSRFELDGEPERASFHRMGVTALPLRLIA